MEKKQKLISALNLLDVQLRKMLDRETKYKGQSVHNAG